LHIYLSGYAKQMTDIARQVQAAYDQIVWAYAARNHGTLADNLITLAARLVQHTGRSAHIIDVGCGTGRDMAWFESHGLTVTGIDLSSGMLAYARGQVSGHLLAMNMCHLGFCHASFDGAWCCAALLHVPKRDAAHALGEIRRVLKSGGRFATFDVVSNSDEPHYPLPWARTPAASFLLTAAATREAIEPAGFRTLAWRDDTEAAKAWIALLRASGPPPSPNLGVVMGPDFAQLSANLGRNLLEGRLGVLSAVFEAA